MNQVLRHVCDVVRNGTQDSAEKAVVKLALFIEGHALGAFDRDAIGCFADQSLFELRLSPAEFVELCKELGAIASASTNEMREMINWALRKQYLTR